eukprot:Gb_29191 [translate_table: standard]
MINGKDLYSVLTAVVPLYVAMMLAYGSVKWWKIFTPDQCSGINRFVAIFAVPLLSFHFISTNDPYAMNYRFIAADSLQKVIILVLLGIWTKIGKSGSLEWMITLFSLSTLPNTLVMGIPLLKAMYGDFSGSLMVQVVVLQSVIWYTLMLFLFEYRGAKMLIMEQFPDTAASIISFRVDSDVVSLDGREPLQTDAEVGEDGKLHVTVRRSTSSRSVISSRRSQGLTSLPSLTPRPSNLTGAEIYSLHSSRNPTPRGSSFNHTDFYSMLSGNRPGNINNMSPRHSNFQSTDVYSVTSSRGPTPRTSNFDEENSKDVKSTHSRFGPHVYPYGGHRSQGSIGRSVSGGLEPMTSATTTGYPAPNPGMLSPNDNKTLKKIPSQTDTARSPHQKLNDAAKELHMFVWSSSASPVSEGNQVPVFGGTELGISDNNGRNDPNGKDVRMMVSQTPEHPAANGAKAVHEPSGSFDEYAREHFSPGKKAMLNGDECVTRDAEAPSPSKLGSGCSVDLAEKNQEAARHTNMPPASVMTRLILIMVWRKLIRNPNTYSSVLGLIWSLVSFRWNVAMPKIVHESIAILSDAGLGMAMFSLGLFMALQPRIIACGKSVAGFAMTVRFLTGPAVMAAASIAVGLRGALLHVAIVQAALPQGIVPFVFAKEYNVHPEILSTAVIFGMLIALPITLLYYVLLGV